MACSGVFGPYAQNLPNSGGTLRLRKPSDAVVLEVTWNYHAPWPVAPDGTGHTLVLARPATARGSPQAWDASAMIGGSPGAGDVPPAARRIRWPSTKCSRARSRPPWNFVELRNDAPIGGGHFRLHVER